MVTFDLYLRARSLATFSYIEISCIYLTPNVSARTQKLRLRCLNKTSTFKFGAELSINEFACSKIDVHGEGGGFLFQV